MIKPVLLIQLFYASSVKQMQLEITNKNRSCVEYIPVSSKITRLYEIPPIIYYSRISTIRANLISRFDFICSKREGGKKRRNYFENILKIIPTIFPIVNQIKFLVQKRRERREGETGDGEASGTTQSRIDFYCDQITNGAFRRSISPSRNVYTQ